MGSVAPLLGMVALLSGLARAETAPSVERLDLPACIARAVAAAPEIATARARVEERERDRQRAKAARFLPEAGITSTLAPIAGAEGKLDSTLPEEQVRKTHDLGPATTVRLGFVQPLWTAGKITAGINAAAAGVEAGLAASARTTAEVVEQTKTLYYNVLLARSVEGVLDDTSDAFTKALATARRRREEGDGAITELDILNLRVGAAEVAKEMPRLRAGGENALEGLKRLMGLPHDAPVDLKDTRLEPEPSALVPLEQYESELFDKDPEWREVNAGVTAKEEEVKRARAAYYPQVFLKGGFDYGYAPDRRRQTNPFVYDAFNYLRGPGGALAVGWNLSFHMTAAEVASKRAELLTVESQRRSARVGLPVQLRVTYRNVLAAREQMEELGEGRGAGRAIVTFSVANFDLGIGEPANILQGLGLYARVSSDYYEAVRNYNVALATLARIMGETTAGPDGAATVPAAPMVSSTK
jgi:outer membrane protein TolC